MSVFMISEDRIETLSEHIEKGLRHLGKAMQCVDEFMHDGYGERGERDDDEWREEREREYRERGRMGDYGRGYGQRRTRDARGRYV